MTTTQMELGIAASDKYAKDLKESGFDYSLVTANTLVAGMRELGYKSTGTALDELVDNALQVGAKNIHVVFGYDPNNKSKKKPDYLAVIDDGCGMNPDMIRAAVLWGGTHRHNDRTSFGRFGFELPSACVSIGKTYTVISKTTKGKWNELKVDLDEVDNHFKKGLGQYKVEEAKPVKLPDWIDEIFKMIYKLILVRQCG